MEKHEKIGNVTLDYTKYPGEDFYCDGEVENEILDIVKNLSSVEYPKTIEEKKNWPVLYHLSAQRENIAGWIPLKGMKVLEVGSGCGAVTGALAKDAKSVTCVDLSKKRSMINAHRHSECENITIHVGNFKDIEPSLDNDFDYIFLIGVFEYAQAYIGGGRAYEDFLDILLKHLKKDGRMIIAIENKYGLKYFAGCGEDHLGTYFSGIENYTSGGGVRTFGRKGLEDIFARCGVSDYHFYYPYPDYKFMHTLYSDKRLPGKGELTDNLRNFDRDRMLLFDEKNAFDGIVGEGLFPVFSNSYLVVLGKDFDIDYIKYSNDRAQEYAIRTEIRNDSDGARKVVKLPAGNMADEHVRQMEQAYKKLSERYEGGKLNINKCRLNEGEEVFAEFEFVEGTPLSALMDACLERNDLDGFYGLFKEYLQRIDYNSEYPAADFDLIFSNILVNGDKWTVIDYEWTFGRTIETKEIAFRAIYCYILENEKREKLELGRILDELGITEDDAQSYREQEMEFQRFVTGKRLAMSQIRELIGKKVIEPQKWADRYSDMEMLNRVQIYEDFGEGCREENSYFVSDAFKGDNYIEFEIDVSGNVQILRIDPAFYPCMVKIKEVKFNGDLLKLGNRKAMLVNGRLVRAHIKEEADCPGAVFSTDDPNIYLDLTNADRQPENTLSVKMEIVRLSKEMALDMESAVKRLWV